MISLFVSDAFASDRIGLDLGLGCIVSVFALGGSGLDLHGEHGTDESYETARGSGDYKTLSPMYV